MPYGINVLNHRNQFLLIQTNDRFGRFVYHLFVAWSYGYQKQAVHKRRLESVGLASRVNLGAEIGSSGPRLREVAGEDGLDERAEDDLGTTASCQHMHHSFGDVYLRGLGKSHPQNEDELEGVVEGEPVNRADSALEHCEEGENDPVCQPLKTS